MSAVLEENEVFTPEMELDALKKQADIMGLAYHPRQGLKKLKKIVEDHLAKTGKEVKQAHAEQAQQAVNTVQPIPDASTATAADAPYNLQTGAAETIGQKRNRVRKNATRLVRFRLTCMNPNKKGWSIQQFAVGNRSVGTIKRYIPFNAPAWHCEEMLLRSIQERKFIDFYEVKDRKGRPYKKHRLVKEFAIEILPPLTEQEIIDLKAQQQARPEQIED